MTKRTKIIMITVLTALIVVAVSTTVGYAIWTGTLNPIANVALKAGEPVEIIFGSGGDSVITDPVVPGGKVVGSANMRCTGKDLNVTMSLTKVEVKFKGETVFKECTSENIIALSTPTFSGRLTGTAEKVDFEFAMKENLDARYVEAEFRITVKAVGTIAKVS